MDLEVTSSKYHETIKGGVAGTSGEPIWKSEEILAKLLGHHELAEHLRDELESRKIPTLYGFNGDYEDNLEQATAFLTEFRESRVTRGKVERIGVEDSCEAYLKGRNDETPIVVNAKTLVEVAAQKFASAEGYHRFSWLYEVEVGNAGGLQKSGAIATKTLAGLLVHTALRFSIPNIAITAKYLRKSSTATLESLGLKFERLSEPLEFVQNEYHFRPWATVIMEGKQSYSDALSDFALLKKEPKDWRATKVKFEGVERAFIQDMRKKMAAAASELRALESTEDTLKNKLYAVPSGWMVSLAKQQREFMYRVINDSVRRRFGKELKTLADYQKKTGEVTQTFSLKDYKEQLDYYWGRPEFENPIRCPNYLTPEMLGFMRRNADELDVALTQAEQAHEEALDAIKLARAKLLYHFPQLKNEDIWKTYKDADFTMAMEKFLALSLKATNEVLALNTPKAIINYFATNASLFDIVLHTHPDQKLEICQAQKWNKTLDKTIEYGIDATLATGTVMAFFPVLAPVGIALDVTAAGVSGLRAWSKARHAARAEHLNYALSTQVGEQDFQKGDYFQRELETEYDIAFSQFVTRSIAAGVSAGLSVGLAPRMLARSPRAALRAWRAAWGTEKTVAEAAALAAEPVALSIPGGASRLVRSWDWIRHTVMKPFVSLRAVERWHEGSLFENFFPYLVRNRKTYLIDDAITAGADGLAVYALSQGSMAAVAIRFAPGIFGYALTKGANRVLIYVMVSAIALEVTRANEALNERATLLLMDRLNEEPERYQWAIDLMLDGDIGHKDLREIVSLDKDTADLYQGIKRKLLEEESEKLNPDQRKWYVAQLEKVDKKLETRLKTETNPNRVRTLQQNLEDIRETLLVVSLAKGA